MSNNTVDVHTNGVVNVFEENGQRHIVTPNRLEEQFTIRSDGYVEPNTDHVCPECHDYNKGDYCKSTDTIQ